MYGSKSYYVEKCFERVSRMQKFDNPKKHGMPEKLIKPEIIICPKCNKIIKNYTAIGGAICWKCKKVVWGTGMMKR